MPQLLDTAIHYAQHLGWSVHPVNIKKKPITPHGRDDATRDEPTIRRLFRSGAQIGVATGAESGLFVLDVDLDEQRGINGYETLEYLEATYGPLPPTPRQRTGRGGVQYLFKYVDGLKNSTGKIGAGIDTRGSGGYIVVAPSHNSNGAYEWLVSPEDTPLADVPPWLIQLLREADAAPSAPNAPPSDDARAYCLKMLGQAVARVATAPDGQKHDMLLKMSRWMGGFVPTLSETEIEAALFAAVELRADDHRNARQTIRDGIAYGEAAPLTVPPQQANRHVDRATGEIIEAHEAPINARPVSPLSVPSAPTDINDLLAMERKPTIWYAQGFLREGLGLLVGQPNVGKTPLAAQLAIAMALGTKWMGMAETRQTKVLYLGMEYSAQELIPLFDISRCGQTIPRGQLLIKTIEDEFPTTAEEAIAELEWYIRVLGVGVIIIDVLTAFLPPEKFKQNIYRGDYSELKPYHRLALQYNAAILGVWHASKRESDPRLMYNGSTGMWAAAASRITMYQDQEQRTRIASFARMADKIDWALAQEQHLAGRRWTVADANPEPVCSPTELTIYRCLKEHADKGRPFVAQTITDMTGVDVRTVRTILPRMFEKNLIQKARAGDGYYVETAVAPVAGVASVAGIVRVADVASQHKATSDTLRATDTKSLQSPKTPEQQEQRDSYSNSVFADIPENEAFHLRAYLRGNRESDQETARERCERFGIDYEQAYREVRSSTG